MEHDGVGGAERHVEQEADMNDTAVGKIRSPVVVILLSLVTIGIYGLYWQYATFKEMKAYAGEGIGGGLGLLFAILLGVVNVFLMPHEVGNLFVREGKEAPVTALTGFWVLIPIVGVIIWVVKVQGRLNEVWEEHGAVRT
jgi:fumarate reductase subunit C